MVPKRGEADYDDDDNEEEPALYDEEDDDVNHVARGGSGAGGAVGGGARSRKGPKRKKRRKNTLIDEEAEEDDADDEDDEDELGDPGIVAPDDEEVNAAVQRERSDMIVQRLERDRALQNDDPNALVQYFNDRYENNDDDYERGAPDTGGIDQQSLLPTIRDPRIWIVRCTKPGYERKAIFSLLQKCFNMRKKNMDIGIFSAVAPEHLKGRIYVEAFSAVQVQLAVNGLELFSVRPAIKALRLDEMPEILKIGKRADKQVTGNWVRIKRKDSIYRGDLAQVYNVLENGNDNLVTIRLIPRLDLKGEKEYMEDVDRDETFTNDKDLGTKRKGRPPQKLFDRKELFRLTGSSDVHTERRRETGEVFDVWNSEMYRFGLLFMSKVNVKSLVTGDAVQPTVEELEQWIMSEKHMKMMFEEDPTSMEADVAARGLELDITSVAGRKITKLFKGDSVRVTHGEQKGLEGSIVTIDGDVVLVNIAEFPEPVRVSRAHITKTFKIGEHVKVSSGKRAGYAGAIVRVDGDFLTIFTESTREEIKVLSSQVADSADVNTDVVSQSVSAAQNRMRYELFDLVEMLADRNDKGVVIQVQNEALTLLTPQNMRRVVAIEEVKGKVRDESVRALDGRGNPVAPNDTIHVLSGPLQNRQGVVKHVAGSTVFFKARDEVNNCGLLAVVARSCTASTAAARRLTSTLTGNSHHKMPAPIPRGPGAAAGRGMGRGGPRPPRDELEGTEIRIKAGPFKGYSGMVIDVMEKNVRVRLASKPKTITLHRDKVKSVNAPSSTKSVSSFSGFGRGLPIRSGDNRSSGNALTRDGVPATPFAQQSNSFNQTPRVNDYSMTPRYSASTPSHSGMVGMTPSRADGDAFRAQTPRHGGVYHPTNSFRPPMTPAAEGNPYPMSAMPHTPATPSAGGGVPSTPMAGSYGGGVEPRTPGGIVEPTTPGYGMEPRTPAPGMEPTTPAPVMEPRTPAPGQEPRTPGPGMEPSTPMVQEPATPHTPAPVPQTPHPQEEETSAGLGYSVLIDVEVLVRGQSNFAAKVTDAARDGSHVTVRMLAGDLIGTIIQVDIAEITPVQPRPDVGEHQELVKVLDGQYASRIGRLQTVVRIGNSDDMEGRIKFTDGEEATLNMSFVAKCSEE